MVLQRSIDMNLSPETLDMVIIEYFECGLYVALLKA